MFRGRLVPVHEVPARMDYVLAELDRRPVGSLQSPPPVTPARLERVHARRYLEFLRGAWEEWVALDPANAEVDALPSVWPVRGFRADVEPRNFAARMGLYSFDAGTPLTSGTWEAAEAGAACAVAAAQALRSPERPRAAMALTRPPGHHAGRDFFGGYCFLNNAALAAQTLVDEGARRVAVLDVDYHHGNGTQSLFYERPDVLTVSIHGDPRTEYPFYLGHADERGSGEGEGCNLNFPLPVGTDFQRLACGTDDRDAPHRRVRARGARRRPRRRYVPGRPDLGFPARERALRAGGPRHRLDATSRRVHARGRLCGGGDGRERRQRARGIRHGGRRRDTAHAACETLELTAWEAQPWLRETRE